MVKNIYFGDFLLQIVLILIRLNRDRLISKCQSGLNLVAYCKVIKKEVEERTVETIVKINEVVNGIVWGVPIMLSCLVSYYTYAERAGEYIFGKKVKPVIKIFWVIVILIGSQSTLGFAWDLADTFNGLMIIPNLIGIIFLSNEAVKMKNDFFKKNVTFR